MEHIARKIRCWLERGAGGWSYVRCRASTLRLAQRLGIEHELALLPADRSAESDIFEYLFAREVGLTRAQIIGLWIDRVDVEAVSAVVRDGLKPTEALLASRMEDLDVEGYASARRAGVGPHEAINLFQRGIDLDVYAAVKHHRNSDKLAMEASRVGVCGLGYRICSEVGLTHERILELHAADVNLWIAARDHRRQREFPYDDFDKFLERAARSSTHWHKD